MSRFSRAGCTILLLAAVMPAFALGGPGAGAEKPGRPATADELRAWDIDVRADFQGLPEGKGDVGMGEQVWEVRCASCHGAFGESNEVFTPLVGGTTQDDIRQGRVANLARDGYPHRTTLMKASQLSSLWDYIYRAMPWTEPKSLTPDEVYGVLAYILNLGDIVPADFTLSRSNMAEVQERMPNRKGKVFFRSMWEVSGAGDVANTACMKDCPVDAASLVAFPEAAKNTHGNLADQVRAFGAVRGTDTAGPGGAPAAIAAAPAPLAAAPAVARASATPAANAATDAAALVRSKACTACHAMDRKLVGPSFDEIAKRYGAKEGAVDYLAGKILKGGQGAWGPLPMPAQANLQAAEAHSIATWLASGAR